MRLSGTRPVERVGGAKGRGRCGRTPRCFVHFWEMGWRMGTGDGMVHAAGWMMRPRSMDWIEQTITGGRTTVTFVIWYYDVDGRCLYLYLSGYFWSISSCVHVGGVVLVLDV
jgi:hypothetical protein